jgi:ferredoxin-NADP reductase
VFVLDEEDPRPRLLIGTGTGLAPLLAILEKVMCDGPDVTSVLVHGVSYREELAYGYRIASWMATGLPLVYRPTLSRPDDPRNHGWRGFTGRADAAVARLMDEMPLLRGGIAYLCGNGAMVEACTKTLIEAGMAPGDVRAEEFHAPTVAT